MKRLSVVAAPFLALHHCWRYTWMLHPTAQTAQTPARVNDFETLL